MHSFILRFRDEIIPLACLSATLNLRSRLNHSKTNRFASSDFGKSNPLPVMNVLIFPLTVK